MSAELVQIDEYDDDDCYDDDPLEFFDCGLMFDGTCAYAGSEQCEFECVNNE